MSNNYIQTLTVDGTTYDLKDSISGYTSNAGTVTSVTVNNATDGGLTISGSPITSSGTITVGHSNVLSSAQTTQAVYPIKIDKNGHISAYGSAVTITDEKLKVGTATSGTTYYPVLSTSSTTASTKQIDSSGLGYTFTSGFASLCIGSSTKAGNIVVTTGTNAYNTTLQSGTLTANNTLTLPSSTGTLALTSDITTAVLTATDDGAGNVTLSVTGVTSANVNSASGVSF